MEAVVWYFLNAWPEPLTSFFNHYLLFEWIVPIKDGPWGPGARGAGKGIRLGRRGVWLGDAAVFHAGGQCLSRLKRMTIFYDHLIPIDDLG